MAKRARTAAVIPALALLVFPAAATAKVSPRGLNQSEAVAATLAAVRAMPVNGSPGLPAATCTRANWMAFRCTWSRGVTAEAGDRYQICRGSLTVVRQQVKGYPITATRSSGTKVTCANAPFPPSGS